MGSGRLDARTGLSAVSSLSFCWAERPENRRCWLLSSCRQIPEVDWGSHVLFRIWNWSRLATKVRKSLELEPLWTRMQRRSSSPMSDSKSARKQHPSSASLGAAGEHILPPFAGVGLRRSIRDLPGRRTNIDLLSQENSRLKVPR